MNWYPKLIPDEVPPDAKILFVGEAGGEQEDELGRPFVGQAGDMLMNTLARYGVSREEVGLANLFPHRPFGNKFVRVLGSQELHTQLERLHDTIKRVRPNVLVPLGSWPLYYLTNVGRLNKGVASGIMKWRGSIIPYKHDSTIKVIGSIHPSAVVRDRGNYPTFDCDIKRIVEDSAFSDFRLPVRRFILDPRGLDCQEWIDRLCASEFLGCDIETVKKSRHILCMGFAPDPQTAVVFSTAHPEGRRAIDIVCRSNAKKIFQNGTFDLTQLKLNGYTVNDPEARKLDRPYYWDTMIAQHVLNPELPRALEYLTSVYTREPYYKTAGRANIPADSKGWSEKFDRNALYEYNAKDCCVTIEIAMQQMAELKASTQSHVFEFEMSELEMAHHIGDNGLPIDEERRALMEALLLEKWSRKQAMLNMLTGYETNVKSTKVLPAILYDKDKLGLPTRRNRDGGVTADEDAIVSLISYCKDHIEGLKTNEAIMKWTIKLNVLKLVLEIRGIRTVLSNQILKRMKDGTERIINGRLHSTVKVAATETGRWAMSKYVDGSGFNAQTIAREPIEVTDEQLKAAKEHIAALLAEVLGDTMEDDEDMEEAA